MPASQPKISRHYLDTKRMLMPGVKGARDNLLIDCISDPGKWKLSDEDLRGRSAEAERERYLAGFFSWVNCGSCRFWIAPLFYLSVKNEQSLRLRRCQSTAGCLSTALSGWAAKRPVWVCVCVLPVWRKAITDLLTCSRTWEAHAIHTFQHFQYSTTSFSFDTILHIQELTFMVLDI